jgi:hypothetical protein
MAKKLCPTLLGSSIDSKESNMTETKPNIQEVMEAISKEMDSDIDWKAFRVEKIFGSEGWEDAIVVAEIICDVTQDETGNFVDRSHIRIRTTFERCSIDDAARAVEYVANASAAAELAFRLEDRVRDLRWDRDELLAVFDRLQGKKVEHAQGEN